MGASKADMSPDFHSIEKRGIVTGNDDGAIIVAATIQAAVQW